MRSLKDLASLEGRVALVTGGAGHLGEAICEALAELGATIVVIDLPDAKPASRARSLEERFDAEACAAPLDLTADNAVDRIRDAVTEISSHLDVLVHAAALVGTSDLEGWSVPFEEQSADNFAPAMEVNLTAPFRVTQGLAPLLSESGDGSVINIASHYGVVGPDPRIYEGTDMDNLAAYAASKGALLQLTRWLATTMAPEVRVNAVTPGGIERGQPDSFQEAYVERTPLRRMATEEDLKGAVAYLASDLSAYVTGQNLIVDGGWTAW